MLNVLYTAGGVFCVLFIVLLLSKRRKVAADNILAGWFLLALLVIVATYLRHGQVEIWQGLFEITDASAFLHGPAVWLYAMTLTGEGFRLHVRDVWHLVPFLACAVYLLVSMQTGDTIPESGRMAVFAIKMLVLLSYGVAVLALLTRHKSAVTEVYSYTERVTLNWLNLLLVGLAVIWVIGMVTQVLVYLGWITFPELGMYITNLSLSLVVLVVGFLGLRQTSVFIPAGSTDKAIDRQEILSACGMAESTEAHIPATADASTPDERLYERIQDHIQRGKSYLDPYLTLYKLADQVGLPPHRLSTVINRVGGKSFFDFVNAYRVEEVKARIRSHAHKTQTLLAIGLDSGFNSKASFNRVFKKLTGKTPREYVEEVV